MTNNDTPIFDSVNNPGEGRAPVERIDKATRRWLYAVAAAALVIVAGVLGWDAVVQENIMALIGAVLNVGGAGAAILANRKTR